LVGEPAVVEAAASEAAEDLDVHPDGQHGTEWIKNLYEVLTAVRVGLTREELRQIDAILPAGESYHPQAMQAISRQTRGAAMAGGATAAPSTPPSGSATST
jgi:hypothetical protein